MTGPVWIATCGEMREFKGRDGLATGKFLRAIGAYVCIPVETMGGEAVIEE